MIENELSGCFILSQFDVFSLSLSLENYKDVIHFDAAGVSQIARPVDELTIIFGGLQSHYCINVLGH